MWPGCSSGIVTRRVIYVKHSYVPMPYVRSYDKGITARTLPLPTVKLNYLLKRYDSVSEIMESGIIQGNITIYVPAFILFGEYFGRS